MKKYLVILCALALCVSCEKPGSDDSNNGQYPETADVIRNAVKDVDGNKYDAVRIGNQVWMASNLRTTHYADGTEIPMGTQGDIYDENTGEWVYLTEPRRYCPDGIEGNVKDYGYLYNWYAVMHGEPSSEANPSGVQGICPRGWHVPSDAEWIELESAVLQRVQNGESVAQALASNNCSWGVYTEEEMGTPSQNPNLNNSTGFSAVPAGIYYGAICDDFDVCGNYNYFGILACYWSATQDGSISAYYRNLYYYSAGVCSGDYVSNKYHGYSVRCLRD